MKEIFLFIFLSLFINYSFGQGDAPPILKGQNQATNQIGAKIFAPNLQITKINSSSSLIETGNPNLFENAGFEHQIFDYATAVIDGTATEETNNFLGTVYSGVKSMKIVADSQPILIYKSTPVSAIPLWNSSSILIGSAMVNSNISGLSLCERYNFTISSTNCTPIPSDSTWRRIRVKFRAGDFQNGIAITTSGVSKTGTVYTDDWKLEVMDDNAPLELKYIQRRSFSGAWTYTRSSPTVRRSVFFYCGGGGAGGGAGTTAAGENKWGEGGRAGELRICNIGNPQATISTSVGVGGTVASGAAGNAGGSTTITGCTSAAGGAGGATATVTTSDIWVGPALCPMFTPPSSESTPTQYQNLTFLGCYNKSRFIQVSGANYRVAGSGGYIPQIIPQLNSNGSEGANGTTGSGGFDAVGGSCGGGGGAFNGASQATARSGGAGGSGQIVVYEYE
jgi:hypothetical protein